MYIGTLPPASNRAGLVIVREVVDDDTDAPIDLSQCAITVEVRNQRNSRVELSATTDNSKVAVTDTGVFQASFTASEMRNLCAGTYDIGCTVKNGSEEPYQFFIGSIPVLDGIVS